MFYGFSRKPFSKRSLGTLGLRFDFSISYFFQARIAQRQAYDLEKEQSQQLAHQKRQRELKRKRERMAAHRAAKRAAKADRSENAKRKRRDAERERVAVEEQKRSDEQVSGNLFSCWWIFSGEILDVFSC